MQNSPKNGGGPLHESVCNYSWVRYVKFYCKKPDIACGSNMSSLFIVLHIAICLI